ncbi:Polynucleotidyl transferase ribonuclease H-like superfamily protein [Euphorbia peplus]|nr:Polynucleotidyl transferase ribonuclease H-like superfamily protein [Euphorbia peplus]
MVQKPVIIREVWAHNLEVEFALIEKSIPFHPLVSFDSEFPGTVFESNLQNHPHIFSSATPHYIYSLIKTNVDVLKIIQLGLTLSDRYGNLPSFGTDSSYIWQFNFSDFDMHHDLYNKDSIHLLQKQGIDFQKNREMGIHSGVFGTRWVRSPVMKHYNPSLTWITFHGGYDVALLIKMITGRDLPNRLEGFMKLVEVFFGFEVYDLKLMGYKHGLHGGLEKLGKNLGVCRIAGNSHEAGSDSLLTLQAFLRFVQLHLHDFDRYHCRGMLYGLCFKREQYRTPIQLMKHYGGNSSNWNPTSLQLQFV